MNKKPTNIIQLDIGKGLAILGVIIIHVGSSVFSFNQKSSTLFIFQLIADQFFRFSVPVFVAISGYSLALSFSRNSNLVYFFKNRILRLLPAYIIFGIISHFLIISLSQWNGYEKSFPLFDSLVNGSVDYHFYFVPMIIQLYILFPVLYLCSKISAKLTLLIGLIIQVLVTAHFANYISLPFMKNFYSDHDQYIMPTTWIFYFLLGIYVALKINLEKIISNKLKIYSLVLFSFGIVLFNVNNLLSNNTDLIILTRFTKLTIIPFASLMFLAILTLKSNLLNLLFGQFGKLSYVIYLSHVIILREVVLRFPPNTPINYLIDIFLTLAISTIVSYLWETINSLSIIPKHTKQTK